MHFFDYFVLLVEMLKLWGMLKGKTSEVVDDSEIKLSVTLKGLILKLFTNKIFIALCKLYFQVVENFILLLVIRQKQLTPRHRRRDGR